MTTTTRLLAATFAIGMVIGGCSTGTDDAGVATLTSDTDTVSADGADADDVDTEAAMLAFAQCMRDEGVDFADPVRGDDGQLRFAPPGGGGDGGAGGGGGGDADGLAAARDACADLLEGVDAIGPGSGSAPEIDTDGFLAFAECMRDNGVADFPDPTSDGRPDFDAMQELDRDSDAFQTASEFCADEVGFSGGGGGAGPGGSGPPEGGPSGGGDGP